MAGSTLLLFLIMPPQTPAGPMTTDRNGFYGFQWGTPLADLQGLITVESGEQVQVYELKQGPPQLGDAKVDVFRLVTIEGQFARVSIRYHGQETHRQVLAYLQSEFGPVERTPGSMMRGLDQQFTWRGPDTEVNLTFEGMRDRGSVFIESRTLAPRFNDVLPEHSY